MANPQENRIQFDLLYNLHEHAKLSTLKMEQCVCMQPGGEERENKIKMISKASIALLEEKKID